MPSTVADNSPMKTKVQTKIESDNRSIAIYHVVYEHEGFEESAQNLFKLVQNAQRRKPGKKRNLYLDIENHKNDDGSFDVAMIELQNEFLLGFLSRYLSEIHAPLVKAKNSHLQDNEIPPVLVIQDEGARNM